MQNTVQSIMSAQGQPWHPGAFKYFNTYFSISLGALLLEPLQSPYVSNKPLKIPKTLLEAFPVQLLYRNTFRKLRTILRINVCLRQLISSKHLFSVCLGSNPHQCLILCSGIKKGLRIWMSKHKH